MRTLARLTLIALVGLTVVACGDDDATADAPEDLAAWCDLIEEVDDQFEETDNSSDDLEEKQKDYEVIAGNLERLRAGVDLVDDAYRDDVTGVIDFTLRLTDAFLDAETNQDVEKAMEPLWEEEEVEATMDAAAPWIEKECGVSID